ncbi:hypothetical protein HDV02_003745 [Globomyces sp. JEL0801]|nr:hypothetical protein HDV02_003745 [Globomyces sp. JEL0801]
MSTSRSTNSATEKKGTEPKIDAHKSKNLANIQRVLGMTFGCMGLVCVMFPETTLRLSLSNSCFREIVIPDAQTGQLVIARSASLMMRCFGSQATLCGTLLLSANLSKFTFKVFGLSMIPFFVFDLVAWQLDLISSFGAVGDALGNIVFTICCWKGYHLL